MLVNMAAFAFVLVLIAVGLWLAETMAQMRRNQDCVLSGRRGCTPVEVHRERAVSLQRNRRLEDTAQFGGCYLLNSGRH